MNYFQKTINNFLQIKKYFKVKKNNKIDISTNLKIENSSMSSLRYIFITVFCTASLVENIFENQFPMIMFAIFVSIFIVSSKKNKVKS